MRTIKEIAIVIKEEYLNPIYVAPASSYSGLCEVINQLCIHDVINRDERNVFRDILSQKFNNKLFCWNYGSVFPKTTKKREFSTCFIWYPNIMKPRLNFLNDIINE